MSMRTALAATLAVLLAAPGCTVTGSAGLTAAKGAKPATKVEEGVTPPAPGPSAAAPGSTAAAKPPAPAGAVAPPVAPRGLLVPSHVLPALPTSLVKLMGAESAGLVGQDGGTLIGPDGGTLVGQDGGTLVGQDGGTYALLQSGPLCPVFDRPLDDVVALVRDDLALVAEVAQIPERAAKAGRQLGLPLHTATIFEPKRVQAQMQAEDPENPLGMMLAAAPWLEPTTFYAELGADGAGGLYVYDATSLDPAKVSHAVKIAGPKKGEVYSFRTGGPRGSALVSLSYDLGAGLAVIDCYRDSEMLYPGRTRFRIEMAKLPDPAAGAPTFVFRATRRLAPKWESCKAVNYTLLARFDAQGRGAVRIATQLPGETTPRYLAPGGTTSAEASDAEAFYIGLDGQLATGTPDPAVVALLGSLPDMLPIPDVNGPENPRDDLVFKPLTADSKPQADRYVTAKEVDAVFHSGVLQALLTNQFAAIDKSSGVPQDR